MELEEEQKRSLIRLLKDYYDYDFSGYAGASFSRRIARFTERNKFTDFFDLRHELLNNKSLFEHFVTEITVNVTEMFRDPAFFKALAGKVFPVLATYPFRRIWHAGCSTGEEVYSMAILLQEHRLYENTKIYATDLNQKVLKEAETGAYKPHPFQAYAGQYLEAGGRGLLKDYFDTKSDGRIYLHEDLKKNMIFSQHNLVSDQSFNEFNLVVCRNVLIYFNRDLQEKVFGLFYNSLCTYGFLALGPKESLQFSKWEDRFEIVDRTEKIYRKIA